MSFKRYFSPYRLRLVIVAIGLTLFQLTLALLVAAPERGIRDSYSRLCSWDCDWYMSITRNGYRSSIPPIAQNRDNSNVAFFPAYPFSARAIHLILDIDAKTSLLVVAQVFCFVFWLALLMFLKSWRIPLNLAAVTVAAILAHPAAFFLIAGYSESMFLASLLLFLSMPPTRYMKAPSLFSTLCGTLMSATRVVGIPAAAFPLFRMLVASWSYKRLPRLSELDLSVRATLLASAGGIFFFVFCDARFGSFDLYMQTQKIGWGILPDYGAILKWSSFSYQASIDRLATIASGLALPAIALIEVIAKVIFRVNGLSRRLPIYATCFGILFFTLSGLKSVQFRSMIRYTLPWYILLTICLADIARRLPRPSKISARLLSAASIIGLLYVIYRFQLPHLHDFLERRWFA